ncbi:homoserine kinase [Chitinasiproducens palmae]|uniref:Homoserine kinase n=1 Tax=Chitinasiproducens palmae TaxID=1770053 RepID=A0A1H2PST4_9BURK|nr:homoserine kinase [Chitinasiproducens palmae]SDV50119.1 homoserine kinase [Chitinasiproducens palmae]
MAVFTAIGDAELRRWLADYSLGDVLSFEGIASGIENSNFFLTTTAGAYVLTIFEKLAAHELPYYLELMRHLASHRVPVPDPIPRRDGALFGLLAGKPASIVTRLAGRAQLAPDARHCTEVGTMLARAHLAGRDFALAQPNLRSLDWWLSVAPALHTHLSPAERRLLDAELATQQAFFASADYARLPGGPCHCDLFRDNALFVEDDHAPPRLGGFFDYYFAGNDKWLFDLAVTANDWCIDLANGALDAVRLDALLRAYQAVRPATTDEARHWPTMLRAAALRFWVSRLYDFHRPRAAALLTPHDPGHFERILRERIAHPPTRPLTA